MVSLRISLIGIITLCLPAQLHCQIHRQFYTPVYLFNAPSTETAVPLFISIDPIQGTKLQWNAEDLVFYTGSECPDENELAHWIENIDDNVLKVWVKIPGDLNKEDSIRMYYGNPAAQSRSNGFLTLDFFDDFSSGFDEDWNEIGNGSVEAGKGLKMESQNFQTLTNTKPMPFPGILNISVDSLSGRFFNFSLINIAGEGPSVTILSETAYIYSSTRKGCLPESRTYDANNASTIAITDGSIPPWEEHCLIQRKDTSIITVNGYRYDTLTQVKWSSNDFRLSLGIIDTGCTNNDIGYASINHIYMTRIPPKNFQYTVDLYQDVRRTITPSFGYKRLGSHEIQFTNKSSGDGLSYGWDFGDGNTSTDTSTIHNYESPGLYDVSLIVSNACFTDTVKRTIEVYPTTIEESDAHSPIVIKDNRYISLLAEDWDHGNFEMAIIDLQGRTLFQSKIDNPQMFIFDMSDLGSKHGMYFIYLKQGDHEVSKRIIVTR